MTRCPTCSSSEIKELTQYQEDFLVQCKNCTFVFSWKIPSVEELTQHYNKYNRNRYYSPITIKRYHTLLDQFETYRKTNNIVDIGCGGGVFLIEAKKRGWNVYGTEYTPEGIEFCAQKGIRMHQGLNLANYEKPENFFDVITSLEVIEHMPYAKEEVANYYQLLRPGGIVYITTPNFNSISRSLAKDKWNILEYPEHLSYYTKKTLTYLFKSVGFRRVNFATTGISFDRLRRNVGSINFSNDKKNDEQLRMITEEKPFFRLAKEITNSLLTLTSKGDTLKATFMKV
jgi:2-polyprenyl-3-methyl-5-hydroxy-6-metoxy-1,4-benzoquinol methylase